MKPTKRCNNPNCNNVHHARGLCSKHYQRVRKFKSREKFVLLTREQMLKTSLLATKDMEKREAKRLKILSKRMKPSKMSKFKNRLSELMLSRKHNEVSISFATGNGLSLASR